MQVEEDIWEAQIIQIEVVLGEEDHQTEVVLIQVDLVVGGLHLIEVALVKVLHTKEEVDFLKEVHLLQEEEVDLVEEAYLQMTIYLAKGPHLKKWVDLVKVQLALKEVDSVGEVPLKQREVVLVEEVPHLQIEVDLVEVVPLAKKMEGSVIGANHPQKKEDLDGEVPHPLTEADLIKKMAGLVVGAHLQIEVVLVVEDHQLLKVVDLDVGALILRIWEALVEEDHHNLNVADLVEEAHIPLTWLGSVGEGHHPQRMVDLVVGAHIPPIWVDLVEEGHPTLKVVD